MTLFGSHGRYRTETLNKGDVGYIPQGYGHSIEMSANNRAACSSASTRAITRRSICHPGLPAIRRAFSRRISASPSRCSRSSRRSRCSSPRRRAAETATRNPPFDSSIAVPPDKLVLTPITNVIIYTRNQFSARRVEDDGKRVDIRRRVAGDERRVGCPTGRCLGNRRVPGEPNGLGTPDDQDDAPPARQKTSAHLRAARQSLRLSFSGPPRRLCAPRQSIVSRPRVRR